MGKEGLVVAKELKRLRSDLVRLDLFIQSSVSRLLKSDLVAVLVEFQRQNQVFLCTKLYDIVWKEIWYRPDMFFYRDMLMMLARNKRVEEAKSVWGDLKEEEVLFDQHTFGDIIRAFLDNGLPSEAMDIYEEMRQSPEPPLSLPFRVILKGLIPYPELREKIKDDDFLEIFPGMIIYDPQRTCLKIMNNTRIEITRIELLSSLDSYTTICVLTFNSCGDQGVCSIFCMLNLPGAMQC
ncbi:Pentatricopeptide repeat-containing protein [Glycine soja]